MQQHRIITRFPFAVLIKIRLLLFPSIGIKTVFTSRNECVSYINELPARLTRKRVCDCLMDSIFYDSAFARIVVYIGDKYEWAQVDAKQIDPSVLQAVGWREKIFSDKPMDFSQVRDWQEKILTYMENNGHPFAKVYLDSLQLDSGESIMHN